ncbi:M20/M25/M40 family metallo-hydrolase [Arthrobacter sp. MMS24-S77]
MSHTTHSAAPGLASAETLHSQATELLQELIRCACVNDGTPDSGQEIRAVRVLQDFLAGVPAEYEIVEPHPGRASLVARIKGWDAAAESLALVGHLDVVPVNDAEWTVDPFGAEILDGRVWGRGAVDMLFLTASYAVVFRALLASGVRPAGDIVFAAVADEESGSRFGAGWLTEHRWDLIGADNVLSEWGGAGLGSLPGGGEALSVGVGEKEGQAGNCLSVDVPATAPCLGVRKTPPPSPRASCSALPTNRRRPFWAAIGSKRSTR